MAGVLSRPLFRQHYQAGGGVSDLLERGRGMGGAALERGMGMGGTAVEYLMKQGLSLEAAIEELKNNPRLIEALERGEALAGGALERGKAMAGEALEGGRRAMERLHGVPPGGFGAGPVNVPPGGFGAGAGSITVPPGGFDGTHSAKNPGGFPRPAMAVEREVGFPRSFDTDHIDSFRNRAGRVVRGLGRVAMNPYVAAASVALPLAYDALTDSPEELLDQLDTQTRAYVDYLMEQGVSMEEALEIAGPSEEAPLEMQAGGPVMPPQAMMPPQGMPPQAMMPPPQAGPAGMDALISKAPEILNQAEGAVSNRMEDVGREYVNDTLSAVDMAEDPEELINALRGTDVPLEQRYDELAQIVGEQDAEATPPSVLALVQPAIMMTEQGAVDSGIGNLMQEFSSSAEMLTGEGEATPMGEGLGNLMMAGAQPAMEALPPEAMMGPPPGAMMGPPPGGMAYGGPVQRFAQGGMVNSAKELARLGRGPDTELVHMSKREIGALDEMARQRGFAGLPLNPQTGLPEAGLFDKTLGSVGQTLGGAARYGGRLARANPATATALGLGGLGALGLEYYGNPTVQKLFGFGDFDTEIPEIAGGKSALEGYTIPDYASLPRLGSRDTATMPSYTAAPLFTADSIPDLSKRAPLSDAAATATRNLREGNVTSRIAPSAFRYKAAPLADAGTTEATILGDPGTMRFDPTKADFDTRYQDPERFKKNFDERLKLYEDVLGSDKEFTKSQMLFDIAGAGLNFAGGRGAGGENVASRSPAAQFAAAFSQVPKTMGERLALQRQEERGVKTAALAATEKEETARREVVADERKLKQSLILEVEKGNFDAKNLVNLTEGKMTHERTLATADRFLRGELARISSSTDLASVAMRGKIQAALGEVDQQYDIIKLAATLDTQIKNKMLDGNVAISLSNTRLQTEQELTRFRQNSQDIRSERELRLRENLGAAGLRQTYDALNLQRAIRIDAFDLGLEGEITARERDRLTAQIQSNRDYSQASQFEDLQDFKERLSDREQRMFEQKLATNFLMATTGQLTREDLLRESAYDRQLQSAMGIDNWNKFSYQLDESIRQFDIEHGLEADSIYGTLALKKRVLDREALEYLKGSTPGVFDNIPGGTQAERDRNIFAMRPLWKRYAAGTLAPAQEDYLSALITGYLDPALNSQGLETRKALPQMALAALQERRERGLTMPIQNAMDMNFEGVESDFFGLQGDKRRRALDRYENRFSNFLP